MFAVVFAVLGVAAFAFAVAAQQGVKLLRHHLTVRIQFAQESAGTGVSQGLCDPGQVIVPGGQHMGLLVVQILDAVLHLAQKYISRAKRVGSGLRHEPSLGHTLQSVQRGAGAQLGKLAAAHHLQQLHGELDLADTAA